jgi:hypothetical protein
MVISKDQLLMIGKYSKMSKVGLEEYKLVKERSIIIDGNLKFVNWMAPKTIRYSKNFILQINLSFLECKNAIIWIIALNAGKQIVRITNNVCINDAK